MNIGKLAKLTGVTPDTLRYYEREGLLEAPARSANGYRSYDDTHAARVRFVRVAQALGFSLSEIRRIVPRLAAGLVDRSEIEGHLLAKVAQIDAHVQQLQALKRELQNAFANMECTVSVPVPVPQGQATAEAGRGHRTRPFAARKGRL